MSESFFGRLISGVRERAYTLLRERVVWVTTARRSLDGIDTDQFAWVAVLGREHYDERRQTLPVRGWRDALRVVALDRAPGEQEVVVVDDLQGDERTVTRYRLRNPDAIGDLRAMFWVPETLLLRDEANAAGVLTVEREGLRYFMARDGVSQIAGGAIRSPELFALAAGVAVDRPEISLDAAAIAARLLPGLARLPGTSWWTLRSHVLTHQVRAFAQPAGVLVVLVGLLYLALVSAYLSGTAAWREFQLAKLGPEVTTLIAEQRAVDILAREREGLAAVMRERTPAWPVWELAAAVWRAKGAIYAINLTDERITIRCSAPVAIAVLESLRTVKGYADARFEAAVRQGGLGEEFVVTLRRVPTPSEPRK